MFGLVTEKRFLARMKDSWESLHSLDKSLARRRNYLQERWEKMIDGRLDRLRRMIESRDNKLEHDRTNTETELSGYRGLIACVRQEFYKNNGDLKQEIYKDINIVRKTFRGEFNGILATIMSIDMKLSKLQGDLLKEKDPHVTAKEKRIIESLEDLTKKITQAHLTALFAEGKVNCVERDFKNLLDYLKLKTFNEPPKSRTHSIGPKDSK